ncbi:hypothetical protein PG996_000554 [Apiospora saccharicola]|uniref:RNase MRP protein 1 RNA binding domain-containing protein n=1 Tax=Apiospora saccharicola TaxID=335842 RepID=A0ABR1WEB9_9PEZI
MSFASTSAKKIQPTPDSSNVYHETLQLVRPLQPLLAGFNHRNKNQHRVATWWASFNMLRRHVTKWADELDRQAKARPKKRKRTAGDGDGDGKKDGDGGSAEVRALWLRDVLVPKCYLTFSQLAADNQFAPLGLVLTGALAQAYKACVRLVGEALSEREQIAVRPKQTVASEEDASPASAAEKGKKAASKDTTIPSFASSAAKRQVSTVIGDDDVGQVISRDLVRASAKTGRHSLLTEEEEQKAQEAKRRKRAIAGVVDPTTEDDVGRERKKKARVDVTTAAAIAGDGDDDVMGINTEKKKKKGAAVTGRPKVKDGEKPPEEKKKKKKSKKGDEFDSLFSSLF